MIGHLNGDAVPFLLTCDYELALVYRLSLSLPNPTVNNIPHVFYWIKVRTAPRMKQESDTMVIEEILARVSHVRPSVVLHKNKVWQELVVLELHQCSAGPSWLGVG